MTVPPRPSGSTYGAVALRIEPRPRTAAYLVGIGSVLVLAEGIVLGEIVELVIGLFLFAGALLIYAEPHHHVADGILSLVLAALTLLFGFGGFYVGALLAAIGAVASIVWSPPKSPVLAMRTRPGPPART